MYICPEQNWMYEPGTIGRLEVVAVPLKDRNTVAVVVQKVTTRHLAFAFDARIVVEPVPTDMQEPAESAPLSGLGADVTVPEMGTGVARSWVSVSGPLAVTVPDTGTAVARS